MSGDIKIRKHKILDSHTFSGIFLLMYGGFFVMQFVIGVPLGFAVSKLTGAQTVSCVAFFAAVGGLIVLFFHFFRFSPEYNWKSSGSQTIAGLKLLWPILIYWIVLFSTFGFFAGRIPFGPLSFEGAASSLMAGVTEEVAFRELPISYMARQWRDEKKIPLMVIIPGFAFGLTHITNILGSKPTDTLAQVALSVLFGIFFSAVYVRTGSIWAVLIMHTLHDLLVFSATVYTPELPDMVIAELMIIEGILAIYGMYLIRKEKRPEIIALWDRKWNRLKKDSEDRSAEN